MRCVALILGLVFGLENVVVLHAADPAPIVLNPGEEYVKGVLVVKHGDKRVAMPERPAVLIDVGDVRSGGNRVGQYIQVDKQLPDSDFVKKRPKIGVSVCSVKPESQLGKSLEPGDVIYRINGKSVNTPKEVASALAAAGGVLTVHFRRFDYTTGWNYGHFDSKYGNASMSAVREVR